MTLHKFIMGRIQKNHCSEKVKQRQKNQAIDQHPGIASSSKWKRIKSKNNPTDGIA